MPVTHRPEPDSSPPSSTCPRCFAAIAGPRGCPECGLEYERTGALLDVLGRRERESRAAAVEAFYQRSPFPGYAPGDDAASLLDRSRQSAFLTALDAAIGPQCRVLDIGCGTGQLAAFLALAAPRREVFGLDGCRASLQLAEEFRARTQTRNLQLVRADIFDLPVRPASFEVVISRGVVHHTPDPAAAIARVAACVAPGGFLVLGFYETWARLAHRARRVLGRALGRPVRLLDPVLRRRDLDPEKKRIWIEDQYRHPEEHILALPEVVRTLDELAFAWVRSVPPLPAGRDLFEEMPRPTSLSMCARRAGTMLSGLNDPDAGLVCYVSRRHSGS